MSHNSSQEKERIETLQGHGPVVATSSSSSTKTRRVVVKEQVADKWAVAAAQRRRPHHRQHAAQPQPQPQQPWCQTICEAQSAFSQWLQQLGLVVKPNTHQQQQRRRRRSLVTLDANPTATKSQPQLPRHSLLERIATLQWAQAVHTHVMMEHQDYNDDNVTHTIMTHDNHESALQRRLEESDRAFSLLDLAQVVKAHRSFVGAFLRSNASRTVVAVEPPPSTTIMSRRQKNKDGRAVAAVVWQPTFCLSHNRQRPLVQLLHNLGVVLTCRDKVDVDLFSNVVMTHTNSANPKQQNSGSRMIRESILPGRRPTTGFLRKLYHQAIPPLPSQSLREDNHEVSILPSLELGVDGPMEVHRLAQTLQRFRRSNHPSNEYNRQGHPDGTVVVRFVVRLLQTGSTMAQWESLVRATQKAIWQEQQEEEATSVSDGKSRGFYFEWAGISVDLSTPINHDPIDDNDNDTDDDPAIDHNNNNNEKIQDVSWLEDRLKQVRGVLQNVLSSFPYCQEDDNNGVKVPQQQLPIRIHLMGLSPTTLLDEETKHAMNDLTNALEQHRVPIHVTVDVSEYLLSHAISLCTRIIGVKHQQSCQASDEKEERVKDKKIGIHYYIDDGCYGSLTAGCSPPTQTLRAATTHSQPTSLKKQNPSDDDDDETKHNDQPPPSSYEWATIWGPTCDGLDRVCEAAWLPTDLKEHDWLVFSSPTPSSQSTSFNGFDPPDAAYCVLGYFSNNDSL